MSSTNSNQMPQSGQWPTKALFMVGFLAIALKLPYINAPISDWHSWNQISVMSMARYIYLEGWPAFFNTKVDLFEYLSTTSNQAFAEFPIIEGLIVIFYHLFGGESEWAARLATIVFSVIGTLYFYLLVYEETRPRTANIAVCLYLISPMVWFFHRSVATDVVMVSFVIAGVYHFRRWINEQRMNHLLLCTLFTALAALSKAYGLYIGLAYLLMILDRWGWKKLFHPAHFILLIGSCVPILAWLWHGMSLADGIEGRNLSGTTELLGSISIWWNPRYWLRLQSSLMDFTLLPLGNLGLIAALVYYKKLWQHRMVLYWFVSVFFYYLFVRQGNMEHDYYQMPFAAPLIFMAAIGWDKWSERWKEKLSGKLYYCLIGVIALLLVANAAKYVHTKARIDWSPVLLGKEIASIASEGEYSIIVDSDHLQRNQAVFYAKTKGWFFHHPPAVDKLQPYIENGGTWLGVSLNQQRHTQYQKRLESYQQSYQLVWQGKSKDRYRNTKFLYVFDLRTP